MKKHLVRDLMMTGVKTVKETVSILDATCLMVKHNIGAVIIINHEGHTVGIFTERDLQKRVAESVDLSQPVSTVMTKNLVCAQLHDELEGISHLMIKGGFRHVPVVDGFEPVGIISMRDMLQYFLRDKNLK